MPTLTIPEKTLSSALRFSEDLLQDLGEVFEDSSLCRFSEGNDTDCPDGWWLCLSWRGEHLVHVMHAFGEEFWLSPVTSRPGESSGTDDRQAFRVNAEALRRSAEEGRVIPLSDYVSLGQKADAKMLHRALKSYGVMPRATRHSLAARALGREVVSSFWALTRRDCRRVREWAMVHKGRHDPTPTWEIFAEECREAGVKDPEVYACRATSATERLSLDDYTERDIGDARRQLRRDVAQGKLGAQRKRAGESTIAHHARINT